MYAVKVACCFVNTSRTVVRLFFFQVQYEESMVKVLENAEK